LNDGGPLATHHIRYTHARTPPFLAEYALTSFILPVGNIFGYDHVLQLCRALILDANAISNIISSLHWPLFSFEGPQMISIALAFFFSADVRRERGQRFRSCFSALSRLRRCGDTFHRGAVATLAKLQRHHQAMKSSKKRRKKLKKKSYSPQRIHRTSFQRVEERLSVLPCFFS